MFHPAILIPVCASSSPAFLTIYSAPPGDLPDPGIEPVSLTSLALAGRLFTATATWEAWCVPSGSPTVCVQGESTDIPQRVPRENPTNVPWCVPSESPTACAQWESHRCPTHVPRESSQMYISPGNLDSSLCFIQPSVSHDVLCIEVK